MKIQCLVTFLDGVERFEKDDLRTVDDARGAYFCENGWAKNLEVDAVEVAAGADETTLDVQSSALTSGDNHG